MTMQEIELLRSTYPEVSTNRGLLNKHYELVAFKFLHRYPGIEYICNAPKLKARYGILREIGRLCGDNEQDTHKIADAICETQKENRLTVREWEKKLRGIRLSETVSDNQEVTV